MRLKSGKVEKHGNDMEIILQKHSIDKMQLDKGNKQWMESHATATLYTTMIRKSKCHQFQILYISNCIHTDVANFKYYGFEIL